VQQVFDEGALAPADERRRQRSAGDGGDGLDRVGDSPPAPPSAGSTPMRSNCDSAICAST
jgi:hypothetical protein